MSKKGGYQILDVHNINFTSGSGVQVEGIGEAVTRGFGKRFVVSGMSIAGTKYPDFEVILTSSDNDTFSGSFPGYTITIVASTNTVTVTTAAG